MKRISRMEPDYRTACQWWEDLPNIWTPVGWREHMFRFNVLYNGTILAEPALNCRTEKWAGQGLQLGIAPGVNNSYSEWYYPFLRQDDRQVRQGWTNDPAPVLWSEWSRDGLLLRSYVFAHVPGGEETRTGIEPLFAWIRLAIHALCPALPLEARHGFNLLLHAPHLGTTMSMRDNIPNNGKPTVYPRELLAEPTAYDAATGLRIIEPDGKVRLGVAPGARNATAEYFQPDKKESRPAHRLYLQLPARKGATVDVLLPLLPAEREVFDRELELGYEGALKQSRRYWRGITACATTASLPEQEIDELLRQSVRFSNVLSERNPETGKLCKINGSWAYAALWTTPGAMDLIMLMDMFGHHETVGRYLDIFRDEQGTVKPPGDAYELHPGYLSTPERYKSIDWLSDNGAVLWTICMHYLLSGDKKFLARFTDCIVRSCEWIKSARAKTGHGGYEGVLPPAVATDARTKIQAVWTAGWNYKGLCAAVRILKEIGHPRAVEFEAEAAAYAEAFGKALRDKCRKMPTWKDPRGRKRHFVPTALAGDEKSETRHAFYLDTGPLFPVFSGLLPASDPLMKDSLAWFREGPQKAFYRHDSNCWQVPALDHEMSSCEPCYSWNVFHSWQSGDRQRFVEGMYSLLAGSVSRQTGISCETRGGITGNVFSAPLGLFMVRLALIDDQIRPGELHLLRLIPLAWLKPGDRCLLEKMPTEFGTVTLATTVSANGKSMEVVFKPEFRAAPKAIVLHLPPMAGLVTIRVNGRPVARKATGATTIKL